MWKRFLFIAQTVCTKKIIFKNPNKYEIVIFDDISLGDLENLIKNYNSFVLPNRITEIHKIYFTFKIIKNFIKNYKGNVMTAYLVSILEIIKPKIVITNIHNSLKFFDIAKVLEKKMIFIAIQNGAQYEIKKYKHLYKIKKTNSDLSKNIYIPNFFCYGQHEIDQHKQENIQVKNFYKVGSLNMANFFHYISKNKITLKKNLYDIGLVSDPLAAGHDSQFNIPTLEKGFATTIKYTIKFCKKHNMKMIFAWKRDKKKEIQAFSNEWNFYKKYLTEDEIKYLLNNSLEKKDRLMSYKSLFQSKVVVATYSTLLREFLGTGGKILSCNMTQSDIFDFPLKGICAINDCTFDEFEKRLLNILNISDDEYFEKLGKDKNYLMEYDKNNSSIEIIRNKLDSLLKSKLV
jgi:surface carbohydrate biosynthesis protein